MKGLNSPRYTRGNPALSVTFRVIHRTGVECVWGINFWEKISLRQADERDKVSSVRSHCTPVFWVHGNTCWGPKENFHQISTLRFRQTKMTIPDIRVAVADISWLLGSTSETTFNQGVDIFTHCWPTARGQTDPCANSITRNFITLENFLRLWIGNWSHFRKVVHKFVHATTLGTRQGSTTPRKSASP